MKTIPLPRLRLKILCQGEKLEDFLNFSDYWLTLWMSNFGDFVSIWIQYRLKCGLI